MLGINILIIILCIHALMLGLFNYLVSFGPGMSRTASREAVNSLSYSHNTLFSGVVRELIETRVCNTNMRDAFLLKTGWSTILF